MRKDYVDNRLSEETNKGAEQLKSEHEDFHLVHFFAFAEKELEISYHRKCYHQERTSQ